MDENKLAQIFNDSYERVLRGSEQSAEFFSEFYRLLMERSGEAAGKFRDTDMHEQVRMLRRSVNVLLAYFSGGGEDAYLRTLAERHSKRQVDIPPRIYGVWLECLIETVRRSDPRFQDEVAAAWRAVFSKGIEFMISRYEG